jgi:hypothetical protein
LTRTFYEANAAEVEDRRRRAAAATKWRTTRSTSVGPFCRRAHATGRPAAAPTFYGEKLSSILRAHAASGGEWDRPRGDIWAHRSSKWPSKERERAVFLSEWEWPSTERASGVGRRRQRRAITTCVSDVRKEATLYGNQMRWVLRHEHIQLGRQQRRRILTSMRLKYEIIGNGLYSPLPIWQWLVSDLNRPLLIGHWSVTEFTSPLPIGLTFVTGSI